MKVSITLIGAFAIAFNSGRMVVTAGAVSKSSKYPPFVQDPIFIEKYGCSITCAPCPLGCSNATIKCTEKPLYIPPKSPMYLPDNLLHRVFANTSTNIPPPYPVALDRNATAEAEWFAQTYLSKYPVSTKQEDTKYALTAKEKTLLKMSLPEWQEARKANKYTCMDMVTASIKRALYLDDVQKMGQFMYMNTFDWIAVAKKEAREYDRIAKKLGTSAIAPMYCYPVPIKGTVSQIERSEMCSIAAILSRMYNNFLTCICRNRSQLWTFLHPTAGQHYTHITERLMLM